MATTFVGVLKDLSIASELDALYVQAQGRTERVSKLGINPSPRVYALMTGDPVRLSQKWENNARSRALLTDPALVTDMTRRGAKLIAVFNGNVAAISFVDFAKLAQVSEAVQDGGVREVLKKLGYKATADMPKATVLYKRASTIQNAETVTEKPAVDTRARADDLFGKIVTPAEAAAAAKKAAAAAKRKANRAARMTKA